MRQLHKMNIAFRVDLSSDIGTGHFSRCLTIANALKNSGAYIKFICRYIDDSSAHILKESGIDLAVISLKDRDPHFFSASNLRHSSWLGDSQESDANLTLQVLSGGKWDCIFVDHYAIDSTWEDVIQRVCRKIFVIDDLADRVHSCDYLLDQNYYENMHSRYVGKVPKRCMLFLGPNFLQLRPEFHNYKPLALVRSGNVKNILVFFGGTDPENYTLKALQAIAQLGVNIKVNVIVGASNLNHRSISDYCKNFGFQFNCQVTDMARLMVEADISIGALGATTWERCYLGLPTIVSPIANNQIEALAALIEKGLVIPMGDIRIMSVPDLAIRIGLILGEKLNIRNVSENCLNFFPANSNNNLINLLINDLKYK